MATLDAVSLLPHPARALRVRWRPSEVAAVCFFVYLAALATLRGLPWEKPATALVSAALIPVLAALESRVSRPWTRVVRDWLTLGLILAAYWSVDWFAAEPAIPWQSTWIAWDRALLDGFGLRAAIEAGGFLLPSALELVYLLLYAVPCAGLCVIYRFGNRPAVHRYLFTLMLGTLTAYALLPHFPSVSPRIAFPGVDLPAFAGVWRQINVWLLDHADISTSVCPSGHVAVAFSTAFALLRALPARRALAAIYFAVAAAVFTATVYCRYHYAVDGAASICIAALAWRASAFLARGDE